MAEGAAVQRDGERHFAALDDVSATEWRLFAAAASSCHLLLHSMMSVLPNGGFEQQTSRTSATPAALDDVSATEWRPTGA